MHNKVSSDGISWCGGCNTACSTILPSWVEYLDITIIGSTCTLRGQSMCFDPNCTCRNVFNGVSCGYLNIGLWLHMDIQSLKVVPVWLQTLGLANLQVLDKRLALEFLRVDGTQNVEWSIDLFPNLEVVRGGFNVWTGDYDDIVSTQTIKILPGPGLAKLRAVSNVFIDDEWKILMNTDLAFLSSLQCFGQGLAIYSNFFLMSLYGLQRVVDGVSISGDPCVFYIYMSDSKYLSNVSALAAYARCGQSNQRGPDDPRQPCDLKVSCGGSVPDLSTWSALCDYIAQSPCS
jgi:hypothetical protein